MMPMRVGTFVHEVISLMSKRFSGLDPSWENHVSSSAWTANRRCVIPMAVYLKVFFGSDLPIPGR